MSNGSSLINIDGLSEPAKTLIEKISDAVGGLYKPYQMRRVAKAQADVDLINAQARVKIDQLQRRALTRFIAEEAKKQDNIENIINKAIPQLTDSSNPQNVDDDWITNFFDKCRIVSDQEMQSLWAKVLAGEANIPGTYSKRTVNLLGSLDKIDAQLFTVLCSFVWILDDGLTPLIFEETLPIYKNNGINFEMLTHLDDIGLISFDYLGRIGITELAQHCLVHYHENVFILDFDKPEDNILEVGQVILTKTGKQLARICGAQPIDSFLDYLIEKWAREKIIISSPYPRQ